jgi:pyruvate, water dikinase
VSWRIQLSYVRWFEDLNANDVPSVGGKNASLGEMIGALKDEGISVPDGFATTADAYRAFLAYNDLDEEIARYLDILKSGDKPLSWVGRAIRRLFLGSQFPEDLADAILEAYQQLCDRYNTDHVDVAVRSSATAEDLPTASFAGQQETFLNVSGGSELIDTCRRCYASLYTDRAISYREAQGFAHSEVALSIGVQKMVRSDLAGSGVMFTIDTETGFADTVLINAGWGLGENIVQGAITPDQYVVYKPLLHNEQLKPIIEKTLGAKEKKMIYAVGGTEATKNVDTPIDERRTFVLKDDEILRLARWAQIIEQHYGRPMDIEWAKDGQTGDLFIVQARPETVQSQLTSGVLKTYRLLEQGVRLLTGLSIGQSIVNGRVCLIKSVDEISRFEDGAILVTGMTDPDWVPIMKRAAGIVTDYGGRTCHAAIVSRELGVPAIVGTGEATEVLDNDQLVTVSCAEGDQGYVYDGYLDFEATEVDLKTIPETQTQILMNIGEPAAALHWWQLPVEGIGLARMEFIINDAIKIHPMALVRFNELQDKKLRGLIEDLTRGYADKTEYFVDHLARGIAKIAASQYPNQVIVRMSDFKTNEYANLIGGSLFEMEEANPMLGFRGASRYTSDLYREGFALECRAIKRVREEIGLDNVIMMIPFCRTLEEADRVLEVLAENDLRRGENGLQIYVMAEIPSNIVLAEQFAERFDGFSIGSNDLTQLTLGVDRDSTVLAPLFDERNEAVMIMIRDLIASAHKAGSKVGICGQAPSDYPEFAAFLVQQGIDSISLNPDSILKVKVRVAEEEQAMSRELAHA